MSTIQDFLLFLKNGVDIRSLLVTVIMSLLIGLFIYFTVQLIRVGACRTGRLKAELVIIPVLAAVTVSCIRSTAAAAVVAAAAAVCCFLRFSIPRYHAEENIALVWGTAAGVCVGEGNYIAAGVLCVVVFLTLYVFGKIRKEKYCILTVRGDKIRRMEAEGLIFRVFQSEAVLKKKRIGPEEFEFVFEIPETAVREAEKQKIRIAERIGEMDGISSAELTGAEDREDYEE